MATGAMLMFYFCNLLIKKPHGNPHSKILKSLNITVPQTECIQELKARLGQI